MKALAFVQRTRFSVFLLSAVVLSLQLVTLSVGAAESVKWIVTSSRDPRSVNLIDDENGSTSTLFAPTDLTPSQRIWNPALSPDGQTLVFIVGPTSWPDRGPLHWGTVGGSVCYPVSDVHGFKNTPAGNLEWVPGASAVLFSNAGSGIHRIDLDPATDDEVVLTNNYFDEVLSIRLADLRIYFWNSLYRQPTESYYMNSNGSGITSYDPLGTRETKGAIWSSDGQHGMITNERPLRKGLWVVDSTGALTSTSPITELQIADHNVGAWSPAGTMFGFVGYDSTTPKGLFSIHRDGTGFKRVYQNAAGEELQVWGSIVAAPEPPKPAKVHAICFGARHRGGLLDKFWFMGDIEALDFAARIRSLTSAKGAVVETVTAFFGATSPKARLIAAFDRVAQAVEPGDTFIFFAVCHGTRNAVGDERPAPDRGTGDEFLVIQQDDLGASDFLSDDALTSWMSRAEFAEVNKIVILPGCYTGGFWGGGDQGDLDRVDRTALIAGAPEEKISFWAPEQLWGGYSALGGATIRALSAGSDGLLNCDTDPRDGIVTLWELMGYVEGYSFLAGLDWRILSMDDFGEPAAFDFQPEFLGPAGMDTIVISTGGVAEEESTVTLPGGVPLVLVRIPAGSFQMGSPDTERARLADEGPVHTVTFGYDYLMGKYEVTQEQWMALMGNNPAHDAGVGDDYPVYNVSWNDCQAFIAALNAHMTNTGQGDATFRLPSESEWERACRAGTRTRFYFGDSLSVDDGNHTDGPAGTLPGNRSDYMWYSFNCCGDANGALGSKPAGTKLPNQFGLYDMHGNVFEWCEDYWHNDYAGAPDDGSAWVSPTAAYRIFRGGGWGPGPTDARSACRTAGVGGPADIIGLRVAQTFVPPPPPTAVRGTWMLYR